MPYHPQTSRQVEKMVGRSCKDWSLKLDDALWAYRTTEKTPLATTQYRLVFEKSWHLPVEIEHKAYWAIRTLNFDLKAVGEWRFLQLNELDELKLEAYEKSYIYKEWTKKWQDKHITTMHFEKGDMVLIFNSRLRLFSGKLKSRWSGPFTITKVQPSRAVKIRSEYIGAFTVNGQRYLVGQPIENANVHMLTNLV